MRPKGMEDLAAISARKLKRAAAEEREREESFSVEGQRESKQKQSHPNELSENRKKGNVRWGKKPEKEGQLVNW